MLFTGVHFHLRALFLPLLVIELFIFTIGIGLILSSLFVRFRDISHIWEVVLQAAFYGTPILYPLSLVPRFYANILLLSPLAQIIQDARYILVTNQASTAWNTLIWRYVWIPYILPFIIFAVGYFMFEKSAAKFAEEV